MKNLIFILSLAFILFYSCKKDSDKDSTTIQTIKGMVLNNCTDSGLANVTVYLNINDGKSTSDRQTVSDHNGNFSFDGVNIHSSSKYSYAIYIPSKSGINGAGGTEVGFTGTTLNFNYDEADMFFKPRVTPKFFLFKVYYSSSTATTNDTILTYLSQNIFHKNVQTLPYSLTGGAYGNNLQFDYYDNYPMGKWNIIIETWKSGVHSIQQDSVYLGWGSTTTYTINW